MPKTTGRIHVGVSHTRHIIIVGGYGRTTKDYTMIPISLHMMCARRALKQSSVRAYQPVMTSGDNTLIDKKLSAPLTS